jgi:outer membrane lipoprotein-sorting protein
VKLLSRLLLLCAVVAAAHAADTPESALRQRLHEPAVLRGSFVQSRQIVGFRRPIESRGVFVVARGRGLLWHTQKPFESVLTVNRERLRVSSGTGGAQTTLDARREPMLRALNDLLQSVVIADVAALKTRFDLTIELIGETGWQLALAPKDAALRARFSSITLSGSAHVQSVLLAEAGGDVTTVRFLDQREDVQLTQGEAGTLK